MPGLLGTVRLGGSTSIPAYAIDTIDLLHTAARKVVRQGSVSMAAAFFGDGDANIGSIQRDGFIGFLFGDPVSADAVDWDSLLAQFRRAEFDGPQLGQIAFNRNAQARLQILACHRTSSNAHCCLPCR